MFMDFSWVCMPLPCRVHDYHHCGLFLPELGELPVAMDVVLLWWVHCNLCVFVLDLLLCLQNKYAWAGSDDFLLWLHVAHKLGCGYSLWDSWALGCE